MSTLAAMNRAYVILIERRLDSIERNLMDSRVSRDQRSEIVQAVERQIYESLEAQNGELTREVVLRVLGSLDPPEAYCGDACELPGGESFPSPHYAHRQTSSFAFAALVLAVLSIPAIIVFPIATLLALAGAICGVVAWFHIAASGGRLGGKWMAIFSFVIFAIHVCFVCCILVAS